SEVVDFLWRVNRDEEALVRLELDQPLLGETCQRFAYHAYAYAVLRAQVGELQAMIGRVAATDQFAPEIQVDGLGAGRCLFGYCHALCLPRLATLRRQAIKDQSSRSPQRAHRVITGL